MSADANHITAPCADGEGASKAMDLAVADAKDQQASRSSTSTPTAPAPAWATWPETKAVKRTFGDYAYKLAISSTKSQLGHLLGASGGIEAIFTALAVQKNMIPPTINLDNPDDECDLDYTPHRTKDLKIEYAMSNSFGFGGHNATLLLKKI